MAWHRVSSSERAAAKAQLEGAQLCAKGLRLRAKGEAQFSSGCELVAQAKRLQARSDKLRFQRRNLNLVQVILDGDVERHRQEGEAMKEAGLSRWRMGEKLLAQGYERLADVG